MDREFRVVAIIAAYNEADIIGQVVGNLIQQGVSVYLLDHGSTDDTVTEVTPYLGRGLFRIERFPSNGPDGTAFSLEAIIRRKEELARELDADWFINHDADEFRESPWPDVDLRTAIGRVDALGYNAIDFELLNFWPTHDEFRRGDDVRRAFPRYEPGQPWDRLQIRCWKKLGAAVDLVSSAGHEAAFEGRRVFPLRFLLRHYPIRSQAHGERKVFRERLPRFSPTERARGWHVQYDGIRAGHCFLRDPSTLIPYDPEQARIQLLLHHRDVERLESAVVEWRQAAEEARRHAKALESTGETLRQHLEARTREVGRLTDLLAARDGDVAQLHGALEARDREARAVYASRSWRWTAPLRAAGRLLGAGR